MWDRVWQTFGRVLSSVLSGTFPVVWAQPNPPPPPPRVGTPTALGPGLQFGPALPAWDSTLRVAACPDMGQTRVWLTWPSALSFLTPAAQNFLRT